jgi:hypothetical protein
MEEGPGVVITFKTNHLGHPVTESGKPVTCDGCGVVLTRQPGPGQQRPVLDEVARETYGAAPGTLTYIACERGADCLTLAELAEELYNHTRCRVSGCTGDRCVMPR